MKTNVYVLILLLLTANQLVAQFLKPYNPHRKIPAKALRADLKLMRSALEQLHPSLYWYTPKDSLDAAFDRTLASLNQPLTERTFINRLYPLICRIRCGHTQLEHSRAYRSSPKRPRMARLPFDVFVRKGRAWIVANNSTDSALAVGSELLYINGVPVQRIIQAGFDIWNGDGFNQTWKEFFLNEYDFFEDACGRVYGWSGPYTLTTLHPDGSQLLLTVAAKPKPKKPKSTKRAPKLSDEEERELAKQQGEAHKRSYLNLRLLDDSTTAVLMVNGLEYSDEEFYRESFRTLTRKGIKNLILDIRRNHGGDVRIISNLLSYLADSNYVFLEKAVAKVADPGKNRFEDHFDADLNRSYEATFGPSRKVNGWYEFDFRKEIGRITGYLPVAQHDRFRGKLYVLIDGGTFSNGSNFAAALKVARPQTVFIGRETGGTELGCGGGTNQKLTLPNSGIVLQFPWMRLVTPSKNTCDGYGLQPDYPVEYTPLAVAKKQDLDLQKALELIRKDTN